MSWESFDSPAGAASDDVSGVDWSQTADADWARRVDPYLFWAEQTRFVTFARSADKRLSAAFELTDKCEVREFVAWLCSAEGRQCLTVAPHWLCALARRETRFFTGRVRVPGLGQCPLRKYVRRLKVGFVGGHEPQIFLPADAQPARAVTRKVRGKAADECVVGIIDFGCSFAHPSFCRREGSRRWATRITHLWEQELPPPRLPPGVPVAAERLWQPCSDFGYGRETTKPALDALIDVACLTTGHTSSKIGNSDVERLCYQWAVTDRMLEGDRPAAHGTQVMDVAAGSGFAHPGTPQHPADDAASRADILFVQMPEPVVRDLSCGWLSVYVLDAVKYLIDRAAGRKLVINLSFGSFTGSHDGESLLEQALDEFVSERVAIVLAAGNIQGLGVHAAAAIPPKGSAQLAWHVPDGDSTQNFLELWYERKGGASVPPRITLTDPGARSIVLDGAGAATLQLQGAEAQPPVAGIVHVPHSDAGGPDGMALVSLAPTMTPGITMPEWPVRAPHGRWRLTVENPGETPLRCHAWVERDEPGLVPVTSAPQSTLEAVAGGIFAIRDANTLSGQCGGSKVKVVGSYRLSSNEVVLARDTAFGPSRRGGRLGPDLVAPGAQDIRGMDCGFEVAASLSGITVFSLGTSLAAPWITRHLVNEMSGPRPRTLAPQPGPQNPRWGTGFVPPEGGFRVGRPPTTTG